MTVMKAHLSIAGKLIILFIYILLTVKTIINDQRNKAYRELLIMSLVIFFIQVSVSDLPKWQEKKMAVTHQISSFMSLKSFKHLCFPAERKHKFLNIKRIGSIDDLCVTIHHFKNFTPISCWWYSHIRGILDLTELCILPLSECRFHWWGYTEIQTSE